MSDESVSDRRGRWLLDLTPLRAHRQFRILWLGRVVSLFGLGMLTVMLSVQVYDLTGSSLHVALVNTVLGISTVLGSLAGGVLADRMDRRPVILISRALAVAGFVALAWNSLAATPHLAVLYAFAVWDGVTGAVGATAFGAAVPGSVPRELLPAAGTLMAISVDLGTAAAPLIGGVLAAHGGPAVVYAAVAVISTLSWIVLTRLGPLVPVPDHDAEPDAADQPVEPVARGVRGWVADLVEGVRFSRRDRVVGAVLLMGFLQIFFASPHVLIPEFVDTVLGGGPEVVGLMYSATSVGAMVATLASGWTERVRRIGLLVVGVYVASGLGIAVFGLVHQVALAVAVMALVGVGDVIGELLRFTVLAERTPDRLRGRVQSLWSAQATVGDSLGGPVLSLGARLVGVGPVIAIGGGIAAATTAALLFTHSDLRRLTRETAPPPVDPCPVDRPERTHP